MPFIEAFKLVIHKIDGNFTIKNLDLVLYLGSQIYEYICIRVNISKSFYESDITMFKIYNYRNSLKQNVVLKIVLI